MIAIDEFARRFSERARAEKQRFIEALRDGRGQQQALLARLISSNADTDFGRAHGFAKIRDAADYRRAVPIRPYEALRPYISRVIAGEHAVLTQADPVLFFMTTGTTGAPKHVPVTRESLRQFASNLLVYWASLTEFFPELLERDDAVVMLHLAPKPYADMSPQGIPMLIPTRVPVDSKGGFPYSRASWFPPPHELVDGDRLYYFLRASASARLTGFVCLHPSRLQSLASALAQHGARLIAEVHDGTLLGQPHGAPDPARARVLEGLLASGPLTPRRVWPDLKFVSAWVGGSFKLYLPSIRESFGAEVIPHMSASSEAGHITMTLDRESTEGPLTVQTNYYEFLPVRDDDEGTAGSDELARRSEEALQFDQLELGRTYEIIFTTCGGLYRYASGDRFVVEGFSHGVPRLSFVGRKGAVDIAGEKITEQHVEGALTRVLASEQVEVNNATCCPVLAKPAYYAFVIEPARAWSGDKQQRVAVRLDEELRVLNPRYHLMRNLGELASIALTTVRDGTFARHRAQLVSAGAHGTQHKDRFVHPDKRALDALLALDQSR